MKKFTYFPLLLIVLGSVVIGNFLSCKPGGEGKSSKVRKNDSTVLISGNISGTGRALEIEMIKGKAHNHPTFAIWIEDTTGKYIQTLFVTRALGQGIFAYGDASGRYWKPGEVRRPAALPYWAYKRGIKSEDGSFLPTPANKVTDAYSGATPAGNFRLNTRTDELKQGKVLIVLEINQPWDWNEHWTNALFPDDADYKSSCQPAVVYSALIDLGISGLKVTMTPIGHSHYSGKNGNLYSDLSTITSALHIAEKITVTVK